MKTSILNTKQFAIDLHINQGIIIFSIAFLLFVFIAYRYPLPLYDWHGTYRQAAIHLLQGESPYLTRTLYNPPWLLLPLLPFAMLPERIGSAAWFASNVLLLGYLAYRMGAKPSAMLAFLFSYPAYRCLLHGQVDGLATIGILLPPQIGLFFILTKPQIGIGIALYWLIEAWRQDGIRRVIHDFAPVGIAFVLSFILFGPYLNTGRMEYVAGKDWNTSFFPLALPLGLFLITKAIQSRQFKLSISASAFLTPYLAYYSWTPALLSIANNQLPFILVALSTWLAKYLAGLP
jgi:hypothetical protein